VKVVIDCRTQVINLSGLRGEITGGVSVAFFWRFWSSIPTLYIFTTTLAYS
jgi:hypothetical protein